MSKFYIQGLNGNKAQYMVSEYDAVIIKQPKTFSEIISDEALVCVIDNGPFDVAVYVHDEAQFWECADPQDIRRKRWVLLNKELTKQLSGYVEMGRKKKCHSCKQIFPLSYFSKSDGQNDCCSVCASKP